MLATLPSLEDVASWSDRGVEREAQAVPAAFPVAQIELSLGLLLNMGTNADSCGYFSRRRVILGAGSAGRKTLVE